MNESLACPLECRATPSNTVDSSTAHERPNSPTSNHARVRLSSYTHTERTELKLGSHELLHQLQAPLARRLNSAAISTQNPTQNFAHTGPYNVIDELEQVVIAAGGHNAAAARLGLSAATLSRWRRSESPYPPRLTALIALLRKTPGATTFSRPTSEATRERIGITEQEYKSLLEMNPGASRSATAARRQTSKLRTAAYVSGTELEAIRTQAGVSLSLAARALGYAKTSLFRLERGLVSQYLVIVARERLPALSSLLAERDPTERLNNVVRALALGHDKVREQLSCNRVTWQSLASKDAHATAKRLLVINGLAHLSYRDAVAIVDGSFFRGQRLRAGSTLTEWAHRHRLATTTYQRIERSHGHGALFSRLSSTT